MYHHLGLICVCCLDYFTTSADAMNWHTQLCKSTAASEDDDDREESPPDYEEDDNGQGPWVHVQRGLPHPINPTSHEVIQTVASAVPFL